ncbi:MAG: hypothetical protein MHM6MM_004433 [Cercozoa sp. M6MM]
MVLASLVLLSDPFSMLPKRALFSVLGGCAVAEIVLSLRMVSVAKNRARALGFKVASVFLILLATAAMCYGAYELATYMLLVGEARKNYSNPAVCELDHKHQLRHRDYPILWIDVQNNFRCCGWFEHEHVRARVELQTGSWCTLLAEQTMKTSRVPSSVSCRETMLDWSQLQALALLCGTMTAGLLLVASLVVECCCCSQGFDMNSGIMRFDSPIITDKASDKKNDNILPTGNNTPVSQADVVVQMAQPQHYRAVEGSDN